MAGVLQNILPGAGARGFVSRLNIRAQGLRLHRMAEGQGNYCSIVLIGIVLIIDGLSQRNDIAYAIINSLRGNMQLLQQTDIDRIYRLITAFGWERFCLYHY